MRPGLLFWGIITSPACQPSPEAPAEFSDAVRFLFSDIEGDEADVATAMLTLEEQIYSSLDLDGAVLDRALEPERITDEDVAGIEHPNRNPADALPVAVAYLSPHSLDKHHRIQLMADHTAVEPQSQDHYYDRTFLEGESCWEDAGCSWMRTVNDLVKDNLLLTVAYQFNKDFRWVDLSASPGHNGDDEPRWAYLGRSWTTQEYTGESGAVTLQQSFTTEVWLPRDGRGYLGSDLDSDGGGTLRMLCLWAETDLGFAVDDTTVIATTRFGMDDNFISTDEFLTE